MEIKFKIADEKCSCTECDGRIAQGDTKCIITLGETKNVLCHDCYEQLQEDIIESYSNFMEEE